MKVYELKKEFIINYIVNSNIGVSTLDEEFVDKYVAEFNVRTKVRMYGANYCKDLSSTLRRMWKDGLINRLIIGISNMPCTGYPKWTYQYYL